MQVITGTDLKRMISAAAECLTEDKDRINALNVFPVPDGDTGTNMALTLTAALRELDQASPESVSKVAQAIARGSLMGARGNSGVILSQFFRGFSDGINKQDIASGKDVAKAFTVASQTTYKAVLKPVEGTMLTVGKAIATACAEACEDTTLSAGAVWEIGIIAGKKALADTPNILPVLKQAGVVDAGGDGLIVALEGALRALKGEKIQPKTPTAQVEVTDTDPLNQLIDQQHESGIVKIKGELVNKYCTEFLIKGNDLSIEDIRDSLDAKGDSMLVVGEPTIVKIHIHTDNPGDVLQFCTQLGDLVEIKIDNMKIQNDNITEERGNLIEFPTERIPENQETKPIGMMAVVPGQGLADIFTSLGVDIVVTGGQTMNPSTEELVKAVESVNAESVIILPNNKNVVFSAQQVKDLSFKRVEVVATRTIPQGISAMMNLSLEDSLEENVSAMEDGMKQVRTGEVTFAVRSTVAGDLRIEEQDVIGLSEGKIALAGQSVDQVSIDLLHKLVNEESSIISIYRGDNRSQEEADQFFSQVEKAFPQCEVEIYQGGQPLYYYILSVE